MKQIGEILKATTPAETGRRASSLTTEPDDDTSINFDVRSDSPEYAGKPGTPDPVACEFCGAPRYHKGIKFCGRVMWMPYGAERCTCPEAVAAYEKVEAERRAREEAERKAEEDRRLREKIQKIIGESGMGERFLRRTFDSFQITENNRKAAATAKRYADAFDDLLPKRGGPEPGRNGLFIAGPPGTGKTHLAAAIANHLIRQGRPVVCMTMIDLLERIRRTYSRSDVDEGSVLKLYKSVPLLVIDDIGKEPPTEWAISTIYSIINGRYEAYLPTIVTTNYDTETLIRRMTPKDTGDNTTARATIDRLMEMCRAIALTGESWRQK